MQSDIPPPLHEDHDPTSETEPLIHNSLQRGRHGSLGDFIAAILCLTSVVALATFTWALILSANPSRLGWFAYHPPLQTLSAVCFVSGILSLQTTTLDDPTSKRKGLLYHQIWNGVIGYPLIVIGGAIMFYNKHSQGWPHFTSWHSRFGLATSVLLTLQVLVGGGSVWFRGRAFGGGDKAKAIYKYHRMCGYLIMSLLMITIYLAGNWSGWVVQNTTKLERIVVYTVLPVFVMSGLAWRIRPEKMRFW